MRVTGQARHAHFNLDGGSPQGPKFIIRPARDPITKEITDEAVLALLQRTLCRAKLGEGAWEVTSVKGKVVNIAFSAVFAEWIKTCELLLKEALEQPE